MTSPSSTTFTTLVYVPVFVSNPAYSNTIETQTTISATLDEQGTLVCAALANGSAAPTTAGSVGGLRGAPAPGTGGGGLCPCHAPALPLPTAGPLGGLAGRHPAAGVEPRRFRPNVVVEVDRPEGPGPAQAGPAQAGPAQGGPAQPEETWVGCTLTVGSATVAVEEATERCAMITLAQPGLAFAPGILGDLRRQAGCRLGVYGQVVADGHLGVGDAVIRSA